MNRVLIVDDEDALLEMIANIVDDLGYTCLVATNGHEALDLLHEETEPPALIISDIMMPKMNGLELLHKLRADIRLRGIPVILMSAAGLPEDGTVQHFLHKPFNIDTLVDLINDLVTGQASKTAP